MEIVKPDVAAVMESRLAVISEEDSRLWRLALAVILALTIGSFAVLFPAGFWGAPSLQIQAQISAPLAVGLLTLVVLLIAYLLFKHIQVRKLYRESTIEAFNMQLAHSKLMVDPLTGVFNRAALQTVISKEIQRAQRNQTSLVFMYADLNHLKKLNSQYGHVAGDLVLAEVGSLLRKSVRGSDYVVRIGGDEFLIVLSDTNEQGALVVKARLETKISEWNESSLLPGYTIGLSIGVQTHLPGHSIDDSIAAADSKMYSAKIGLPNYGLHRSRPAQPIARPE